MLLECISDERKPLGHESRVVQRRPVTTEASVDSHGYCELER
jgi:hypothetical protein